MEKIIATNGVKFSGKYLYIFPYKDQYAIENHNEEHLGWIERIWVGRWMSWCLLLNDGCYMSAGCLDEIKGAIRTLNGIKKI